MSVYRHLSYEERVQMSCLRQSESSITEIAEALGRSKSTISRELRRNEAPPGEYWPDTAHQKARDRRHRECRLDRNRELQAFVKTQLTCEGWTPEQISGWLKTRQTQLPSVSHETIYSWLYQSPQKAEKLWKFLPRHQAKRGLRKSRGTGQSRIPNRISISERPPVGGPKRTFFGHWEGDLMAFQKNSQHILVLRERKSMLTLSCPLSSKRAEETAKAIQNLLQDIPKAARKTLTFDNGTEFAHHEVVAQALELPTFFCDPYSPWQKGGVENTNGRLRRDLPRTTRVKSQSSEDFQEIITNHNTTPRKKLQWLTPIEAFNQSLTRVALQT